MGIQDSCGKFGDCIFSRVGSIMWTDRQTDTQTEIDADERFTPAILVGTSNNNNNNNTRQCSLQLKS